MRIVFGPFALVLGRRCWKGMPRNELLHPFKINHASAAWFGFRLCHRGFTLTYNLPPGLFVRIMTDQEHRYLVSRDIWAGFREFQKRERITEAEQGSVLKAEVERVRRIREANNG